MKDRYRLLLSLVLAGGVYALALYVIPHISFIHDIVESTILTKANITQFLYLFFSLILIYCLGNKRFSDYGFRASKFKTVVWAVVVSIPVELAMLFVMIFAVLVSGGISPEDNIFASMSFVETVLSVWIIASFCEEVFFRGFLYGYLSPLKKYGFHIFKLYVSMPVIVCAVLFGLAHLCLLGRMPGAMIPVIILSTTLLGFIAGYFREQSGSLVPAVAAHVTFNIVGYGVPKLLQMLVGGQG
ncbi:MAG: CPBP family intramembrane glutamic endopeptidase [Candidatus Zixiibacteriota bacterium]